MRLVASGLISPLKIRNFANFDGFCLLSWRTNRVVCTSFMALFAFWNDLHRSGYGYTGGPFPLAYRGLGDVFVILFLGWARFLGPIICLQLVNLRI